MTEITLSRKPNTVQGDVAALSAPAKLTARNLNFYYGDFKAIKDVNFDVAEKCVTSLIGPSGCGKSTLLRIFNRIYSIYPGMRAEGQVMLDGENVLDPKYSLNKLRSKIGMVFQKPVPFPMTIFNNISYGIGHYESLSKADMNNRVEEALRQAALWDEVKDKLGQSALGTFRRTAATSLHRPRRGIETGSDFIRRTDFGTRPDCDRQDRTIIRRTETAVHDPDRDAQHAAGGTLLGLHGFHVPRRAGGIWRHGNDVYQTHQAANRRLYYRSFRLNLDRQETTYHSSRASIKMGNSEHIVKSFDSELQRLYGEIQRMGEIAIAQLDAAVDVLQRRDSDAARRVVANDDAIDALEHEVSNDVLRLLALRQPMARDLREVYAALRISSDIERIGDYAANVAKRSMVLNQGAPVSLAHGLPILAKLANSLVKESLHAYANRDADAAKAVRDRDAELDMQYTALFRELLTYMAEDPKQITPCTHLLFMAKNIERIGDHATNIAENTWFLVHGETLTEGRDKRDLTSQ